MLQLFRNGSAIGKALAVLLLLLFISIYACSGENDNPINEKNASGLQQENISPQIHADLNNPGQKANASTNTTDQTNSILETIKYISFALALLGILITSIFGFLLLKNNYSDFLKPGEIKENDLFKKSLAMIMGIALLLLSTYLLLYLISLLIGKVVIPVNTSNAFLIMISVLLGLAIFGSVIFMCQMHSRLKEKETGVMRKTIAGLLVIGLVVVIFFALTTKIENDGLITQYIQLVGIIIAFYFGSRSAGSAVEAATAENRRKDEAAAEKIKKADAAASEAKKLENEAAAIEMKKNDNVAVAEAKKRDEEADVAEKKRLKEEAARKKEEKVS